MIIKKTKRAAALVLALILAFSSLSLISCEKDDREVYTLSFSEANSIEDMEKHDGEKVSVIGYMSTLSPVNGEFMYLMNLPYQSCPFCVPNTTQLSNTLAIYAKEGKKFEFTDMLIKVEGELEFGEYTDAYGYSYSYRIKDATYSTVDTSELDEEYKLWQQLAASGVIGDVYAMYDYVSYVCFWPTYTANLDGKGSDYLYPGDVMIFLDGENTQYGYGYVDGYFDKLVKTIEEVDKEAFADLVANIRSAEALAQRALDDYKNERYSRVVEYSGNFRDGRTQYKMNDQAKYETEFTEITDFFYSWIAEWEV